MKNDVITDERMRAQRKYGKSRENDTFPIQFNSE